MSSNWRHSARAAGDRQQGGPLSTGDGEKLGNKGGLIVGVDASNIRSGGGMTHLVELLAVADPRSYGFDEVILWGSRATLSRVEDRAWLVKQHLPVLDRGLVQRAFWQRFRLSGLARQAGCTVLFVPGGSYAGIFHPIVTMSRNLLPFEWREMARYGLSILTLKWIVLRWAQSKSFRNADGLIFLTQYANNVVTRVTGPVGGQVVAIPHGVDERFVCPPRVPRVIGECSAKDPLRLLYVSNVDAHKHQWNVAEAVAELRAAGFPVTIDLAGSAYGPAMKKLKVVLERVDPSREFIRYAGVIPHDELHRLYHAADVCVFASSCENMPNILLEGMAAGLPIACSVRGPMPEILGDAGVYFDPEQSNSIRQAIEALIISPSLRAEKARSAFYRARLYSWRRCADETFAFLAKVAAAVS